MIFIARFLSLVGATTVFLGAFTVAIMVLLENKELRLEHLQDKGFLVILATALGAVALTIGQLCGNDLFKVTGKDSIIALKDDSDSKSGAFSDYY